MQKYTLHDTPKAAYTLAPLTCLHCGHTGEVTYNQGLHDADCAMCGKFQIQDGESVTLLDTENYAALFYPAFSLTFFYGDLGTLTPLATDHTPTPEEIQAYLHTQGIT